MTAEGGFPPAWGVGGEMFGGELSGGNVTRKCDMPGFRGGGWK